MKLLQEKFNAVLLESVLNLDEGGDVVEEIRQQIIAFDWDWPAATPDPLQVWEYRQEVIANAPNGLPAELAHQVEQHWETVSWYRNPNYVNDKSLGRFRDWYGYTLYVGSFGMLKNSEVAVGMLLIAPNCLYPSHNHAAAEIYVPISGRAEWWNEESDWQIQEPGTPIYHRPWLKHGTRTHDEPLLALFGWLGNTSEHATISR